MGFQVNKPVPFVPVKDVSDVLFPGGAVGVSMDGNYLYSYSGLPNISTIYDLHNDHTFTLKQPFSNATPYRNSIFPITGDLLTPRIIGTLGNNPVNNGQQWSIAKTDNGDQYISTPMAFADYATETVRVPFNNGGVFLGLIPVASTNDGSIVTGELWPQAIFPLQPQYGALLPYFNAWKSAAGFSYALILSSRTANLGGSKDMAFIVRNAGLPTQEVKNVAFVDTYTDFTRQTDISGFPVWPSSFDTCFKADSQPMSDIGSQRNYNFQIFEGLLFIGCVGANGGGTVINPVTGFTDLASTAQSPPFVFALGQAIVMNAAFPPSFSIGATNYSGPNTLRCLTMMGCDLYAVVNYTLPDPGGLGHGSHVLMELGYFLTLNINSHSGTYNWKRSLQYGIGKYMVQNGQVVFLKR